MNSLDITPVPNTTYKISRLSVHWFKTRRVLKGFIMNRHGGHVSYVTRPRGYKTFFMLNSIEHEILNAHKYKNIQKFGIFQAQISLQCYFFPLINVKMPTIVGILTFMSWKKSMLS